MNDLQKSSNWTTSACTLTTTDCSLWTFSRLQHLQGWKRLNATLKVKSDIVHVKARFLLIIFSIFRVRSIIDFHSWLTDQLTTVSGSQPSIVDLIAYSFSHVAVFSSAVEAAFACISATHTKYRTGLHDVSTA